METNLTLTVNGKRHELTTDPDRPLLDVLREDLQLTGTKYGCGEGQCGACTVLLDGVPTRSCITVVGSVGRRKVTTVESLEQEGRLHPLQQAFLDVGALQCGYCTSGMIMAGVALLATNPDPDESAIVQAMDRHICRCGAYPRIVQAIQMAATAIRAQQTSGSVV